MTMQNELQNKQANELLPVKNDYVFSLLFGAKNHEHLLISLLNAVLNGKPRIKSVKLEPTEYRKTTPDGKSARLDIVATTDDGTIINVEMQNHNEGNIEDRAFYYQCVLGYRALKAGIGYSFMPNVITIWFCAESVLVRECCCHEHANVQLPSGGYSYERGTRKVKQVIIELNKLNIN